jgi:hypothetical protein
VREGRAVHPVNCLMLVRFNESFDAFVDFASSTGNQSYQTTTLCFKSTGVQSPEKKIGCQPLPGPAATYFGGYFYLMVNN